MRKCFGPLNLYYGILYFQLFICCFCFVQYCIDVVHASSKRPFGQSQLCVYVDEVLHVSANLKFPALGDVWILVYLL